MLKHFIKPKFFVCEYDSNKCSGHFACLATNFDAAVDEATEHVSKIACNGTYKLIIRKATLIERIKL